MIPYGIYVLTANGDEGLVAATVNWLTQTSFESPLIAVVLKHDCYSYASVDKNSNFTLNKRCKGQQGLAVGFFKHRLLREIWFLVNCFKKVLTVHLF